MICRKWLIFPAKVIESAGWLDRRGTGGPSFGENIRTSSDSGPSNRMPKGRLLCIGGCMADTQVRRVRSWLLASLIGVGGLGLSVVVGASAAELPDVTVISPPVAGERAWDFADQGEIGRAHV